MEIDVLSPYQAYQIAMIVNFGFRAAGYQSAYRFTHPTGLKIKKDDLYRHEFYEDEYWSLEEAFDYVENLEDAKAENKDNV